LPRLCAKNASKRLNLSPKTGGGTWHTVDLDSLKSEDVRTVGIVLDEDGFAKTSKVFPGNVSEPSTLEAVVDEMLLRRPRQLRLAERKLTVVIDAGIATEANLEILRAKGLDYVCVDRRRVQDVPEGEPHVVHDGPLLG